jgi:CheY-like chemotaxis protein
MEDRARVQGQNWHAQTQRELASLDLISPGAVSDVAETINGVKSLEGLIDSKSGVWLEIESVQPNLVAAVHPSALRQMLITAVRGLARGGSRGPITAYAGLEDGSVRITLTATVCPGQEIDAHDIVADIVAPEQVSFEAHVDGCDVSLRAKMPAAEEPITVLVVDDNADMIHFHRRSMAGTRYRILPATRAEGIFETIEATAPDAIILDVMLPDVDGWELLTRLHNDPATRLIPVVVCTVVRERDLALSLGAARYLPKPVRRRDIIRVLDEILPQA